MNLKLNYIGICFIVSVFTAHSQNTFEIDSSYTIHNTFKKYIKQYPDIQIVKSQDFENVIEEKDIEYKDLGYRKLLLDAYYNNSKVLKPAVILIHGGGWKSGNKSLMEPMAQHIASKGYACFTVDYRLSLEAIFPAGILDVKNAIQFVKTNVDRYFVDTTKVVVLGCSAGGQMAALIGTTNKNKAFEDVNNDMDQSSNVQAIVDIDGILAFKHPESEEGESASLWLGGNSEENLETWINASALTHTDQNTPPILFISSKHDRFQAGRDDMIKILDQYNIYNQVENFPNAPHSFWLFHPWFEDTVDYVTKFLDKTFK
jgi:pectinesterase